MNSQTEPKTRPAEGPQPKTSKTGEDQVSGFIWRTFVGNKKKEDFLKSSILLLIIINGLLGFFLFGQKNQKSVYVIDEGVPKLASLVANEARVDEQIVFFVKLWTKLLIEINSNNYQKNREILKTLSSQSLMQRILTAESASSNRLVKEVIQTETIRLKVADIIVEKIERRGSILDVTFNEVIQIDLPTGSERYATQHKAEIISANYNFNGIGLIFVNIDNLWILERRI